MAQVDNTHVHFVHEFVVRPWTKEQNQGKQYIRAVHECVIFFKLLFYFFLYVERYYREFNIQSKPYVCEKPRKARNSY